MHRRSLTLSGPLALLTVIGLGAAPACVDRGLGDTVPCDSDVECDGDSYCQPGDSGASGVCVPSDDAGDMSMSGDDDDGGDWPTAPNRDVDILVVIDNSGSMAEQQAILTVNLQAFVRRLEAASMNFRLGFTTTDNGNVECSGTSPEGGMLRLSPCTQRADEFTWPKVNPQVQAYDEACAAFCPPEIADAIRWEASGTANDSEYEQRPWVESIEGVTNLSGAPLADIVGCFAPQGVDGCGFESQLETMFKAVQRSTIPSESQYDFFRESSAKVFVIITDEADCSANESQQAAVFDRNLSEAQKVFWSDPTSNIPTSAICWNAGVMCSGSPDGYTSCDSFDYTPDGSAANRPADDAVLRPVSRYTDFLQSLEDAQKRFDPRSEVLVTVIGGVPEGYGQGAAELVYRETSDPMLHTNFGIDYGCEYGNGEGGAVPPVRLREFAEGFDLSDGGRNMSSVCGINFVPAFDALATELESVANVDL